MKTKIIECTNGPQNWGKFLLGVLDKEFAHESKVDPGRLLLTTTGYDSSMVWVLDLQTREGACFRPGGFARADLVKHRVWVCPLFEPFLTWLYTQADGERLDINKLPDHVDLPYAPYEFRGSRRPGPAEANHEKMGPLSATHPLVLPETNARCPGCPEDFKAGDYVTLVTVGPGDNAEQQEKAREGQAFNAVCVPAHWTCVTGEP